MHTKVDEARIIELLGAVGEQSVGVIGDFCLDAYWRMDTGCQERSVETGKRVHRVLGQQYSLGGAGNVVANLSALETGRIMTFGVIGDDLFGREMLRQLTAQGADCTGMCLQQADWDTTVYAKPYDGDEERSRFDFGTANRIASKTETALLGHIAGALPELDALIINQQLPEGYHSARVIGALNQLVAKHPDLPVLVDARHTSGGFKGAILKLNAVEAAAFCGEDRDYAHVVPPDDLEKYAAQIHNETAKPVIITCGERGMALHDGTNFFAMPGIPVAGEVDPVGAGDTACAAFAALLGAGAALEEAGFIANMATSVTVQKLRQCGTATQGEILACLVPGN
jgi:rfaE bifunctional protein kinase chain/domain